MKQTARFIFGTSLWVMGLTVSCTNSNVLKEVNTAPIVSIITPIADAEFQEYQTIEFTGKVSDGQEGAENLSILWTSDIDGNINEMPAAATGDLYFATANLTPGLHTITLTATDSTGMNKSTSVTFNIEDQEDAPTIELRDPLSGIGEEGVTQNFEVLVNDVQDAPEDLIVTFSSDIDGDFCTPIADALGIAGCEVVLNTGTHQMLFSVEDSHGFVAEVETEWEVLPSSQVDNDGDGFTEEEGDCDDAENLIYPGAVESYNDIDDDCDGQIDEDTVVSDDDGDGFTELGGDCNDDPNANGALQNPYEVEICNGIDDDCDGQVDEGTSCVDDDGDGFTEVQGDCDDDEPDAFPFNTEITDGIDNDCNGHIDEGSEFFDDDGDCFCELTPCYGGYMPCAAFADGDCDDGDADVNPDADEVCDGGIDNDCSGAGDDNAIDALVWYQDADGDSYGNAAATTYACTQPAGFVANTGDCNDGEGEAWTGRTEVCDYIDNNCNNQVDEGVGTTYYLDFDQDSYGDANQTQYACSQPAGYVGRAGDCNDSDSTMAPNLTEVCGDGKDNNCNNDQNEQNATNCITYYVDSDGDGYGSTVSECWCQPTGIYTVTNASDCYDGNIQAHPGQNAYFTMHRGDGSYDYNCDTLTTKELNTVGSCNGYGSSIGDCTINTVGWAGSTPACGASNAFLYDNNSCSGGCEVWGVPTCCEESGPSYGFRTQACR